MPAFRLSVLASEIGGYCIAKITTKSFLRKLTSSCLGKRKMAKDVQTLIAILSVKKGILPSERTPFTKYLHRLLSLPLMTLKQFFKKFQCFKLIFIPKFILYVGHIGIRDKSEFFSKFYFVFIYIIIEIHAFL